MWGVAVWESGDVAERRCREVAVWRSRGVLVLGLVESRSGGVAMWGSFDVGEFWCGGVAVWGSCGVGQSQCRGVAV